MASRPALSVAPKGNSVLRLPLWVCPDCRRAVEKEERHGGLDPPAVSARACRRAAARQLGPGMVAWVCLLGGAASGATPWSPAPPSGPLPSRPGRTRGG